MEGRPIRIFVAECYCPGLTHERAAALVSGLREAAPAIEAPVRIIGWILFADDEVLFVLVGATHRTDVLALAKVAEFPLDRVASSVVAATAPLWPAWPHRQPTGRSTA